MNYIDLGLSVKWADCNIDANNPDEYGTYFNFDESLNINNIPTKEQWEELQKNCKFSFDKKHNGIIATGTNGNTIFLPFACEENGHYDKRKPGAFFWASTEFDNDYAWYAYFSKPVYSKKLDIGIAWIDKQINKISLRTLE